MAQSSKGRRKIVLIAAPVIVAVGLALFFMSGNYPQLQITGPQQGGSAAQEASSQTRDDFGCWPPSCGVIPFAEDQKRCEDWKDGKEVQWPDCSFYASTSPNCKSLCEAEKQQVSAAKGEEYRLVAEKIAAHELPPLLTLEFNDVPEEDEEKLREGIKTMDYFLKEWYGHSITRKSLIRVSGTSGENRVFQEGDTVVADMGLQEGSEFSMIKQFAQFEPFSDYRVRYIAHEYVHFYQMGQGCVSPGREGETFTWFTEGSAEWLSFKAQRESGKLKSDMTAEQWVSQRLGQINVKPLKEYEGAGRFEDVYSYFTLAVEFLMKEHDIKALESFCANLGEKQASPEAFQDAFGVSLEKFYSDFESYYQDYTKNNQGYQNFPR